MPAHYVGTGLCIMYIYVRIEPMSILAINIINAHRVITDLQTSAPMNIMIPPDDITSESFIVQWDAVTELAINYSVRWYGEDVDNRADNVTGLSYTVTGLAANTSYNVTVAAMYCGEAGLYSVVMMTMTNMRPTTPPQTSPSSLVTIPTGNICFTHIMLYIHVYIHT